MWSKARKANPPATPSHHTANLYANDYHLHQLPGQALGKRPVVVTAR